MRLAAAAGMIAVTLASAVYLHQRMHLIFCGVGRIYRQCSARSSWQDPVAVIIALAGIAVAAGILTARRNFAKPSY
jgi:hypothetical protein